MHVETRVAAQGRQHKLTTEKAERGPEDRSLPDLPRAITSFGATVLEESIYVYGGHYGQAHHYSREGQAGELLRLNLKEPSEWQIVATGPRLQGLALVAQGGTIYRIGGFEARNKEDEAQDLWSVCDFARFDPGRGGWKELTPMPVPRSSFDAVVVGDRLYVIGGWAIQGEKEAVWHDDAYAVNLSSKPLRWNPLSKPPFQRRALSVGACNGKVYVIGGMQPDGEVTTRTTVFHPDADKWVQGPEVPGDGMEGFGTACTTLGERLYVSTASGKVVRLSPDGESWQIEKELSVGRFFHRMLPIDRQYLAVLGGANMNRGKFSKVELTLIST